MNKIYRIMGRLDTAKPSYNSEQAQRILNEPMQSLPNVEQLAQHLNVGRVTLFRLFRDHLKATPAEYIDDIHYQRACSMLVESNLRLKEIAALCGLASHPYFSHWFSRRSGLPPPRLPVQ